MSHQRKPRTKQRRVNRPKTDIVTAQFSDMKLVSLSASASQNIQLNFQTSTRMAAMSLLYEFYRITRLRVEILPSNSSASGLMAYLAVQPGVTSITTYADGAQVPRSICFGEDLTVPVRMSVPKRIILNAPEKWFSTNTSSTAYSPTQGELLFLFQSAITTTLNVRLLWTVQYRAPTLLSLDLPHRYIEAQKELEELKKKCEQNETLTNLILTRTTTPQ